MSMATKKHKAHPKGIWPNIKQDKRNPRMIHLIVNPNLLFIRLAKAFFVVDLRINFQTIRDCE